MEYNVITVGGELYHYGVPGMKWGHRKSYVDYYNARANRYAQRAQYNQGMANLNSQYANRRSAARYTKAANRLTAKANKMTAKANMTPEQRKQATANRNKKLAVAGLAVAGTAVAAVGAYKLSKAVKNKAANRAIDIAFSKFSRNMDMANKVGMNGNTQMYDFASSMGRRDYVSGLNNAERLRRGSTVNALRYLRNTRNTLRSY